MNDPQLPVVELRADELPAYCPNPSMPVWNHHPRVFLEVQAGTTTMCPYCGTRYRLAEGEAVAGRHGVAGEH
ncbi:MAG TPA: zinc-finger domain-containing protein [Burkholderiaceae bacterium]|nr:zinc-finger domain-containing protein [Burkholderiaceae bacterium]